MAKVALLVGVSEYQLGFNPLLKSRRDVEEMQRVLQNPDMDGFDQIKTLIDPDPQSLRVAIEALFSGRSKEDLALLFFSGHGIKDDRGNLYLATRDTRKTPSGELIRATAVEASFVQSLMSNSRCKRQVVVLDCCFSGAFAVGMVAKDSGLIDIEAQLGGEGRAVLTSSTSTQYSFEEETSDLSIYTRYLVEGLETGAADLDRDGWIEVEELHAYAKGKVQETAPAMKPEIYAVKEGFKIRLTRSPVVDPKSIYWQEVEQYTSHGEISQVGRMILDTLRKQLGVSAEKAQEIEDNILRPYQERVENLQRYKEVLAAAIKSRYPLNEQTRNELKHFQDRLGLRDQDVASLETEFIAIHKARESDRAINTAPIPVHPQHQQDKDQLTQQEITVQTPRISPQIKQDSQPHISRVQIKRAEVVASRMRRLILIGGILLGLSLMYSSYSFEAIWFSPSLGTHYTHSRAITFLAGYFIPMVIGALIILQRQSQKQLSRSKKLILLGGNILYLICSSEILTPLMYSQHSRIFTDHSFEGYLFYLLVYSTSLFIGCW